MPITENSFTAAEVQAAVTANPALLAELKTGLTPLGHYAIPKDEYSAFVETERGRIRGEETSNIYSGIDKDVFETAGVAKSSNEEKTYDYVKRVLGANKQKEADLAAKIIDLEKKVTAGSTDEAIKAELATAKDLLKKYSDEIEPGYKAQLFQKDVEREFAIGLRGLKLRTDLPDILMQPALKAAEEALLKSAKTDSNGKIYYTDKDGKAILDGVNIATADFVLKDTLKDLIDTGLHQPGGGTKPPSGPGASTGIKNKDGVDIVIPETIKTKVELQGFLSQQGLSANSKEFNDLFLQYGKDLKLR